MIRKHVPIIWRAARVFALPASVMPVVLGVITAWVMADVSVHWGHFLLSLAGVILMHSGANMFNDYFDYIKSVDREGTLGSSGLLVERVVSPRYVLVCASICYALAVPVGIYLWFAAGPWVLWIGVAGAAIGLFYTFGPSLKFIGLGDLAVFMAFGIFITLGAYYVQTGRLSWFPALYAIPLGLLIDAILHGNNLRDIESDSRVNANTLAVTMGVPLSRWFYLVLVAGAYSSIPVLVFADGLPFTGFLVIISLPLAIRNIRLVFKYPDVSRETFRKIDELSAQLQLAFSALLVLGLAAGRWI